MRKVILPLLALSAVLAGNAGWAADTSSSTYKEGYRPSSSLKNEVLGVKPEIGTLAFRDPNTDSNTARAAVGVGVDVNFVPMAPGTSESTKSLYMGVSTGAFMAHLGASGSTFWGTGSGNDNGANGLIFPLDLKVGANLSDMFRVSLHGGTNVIYRTVASSLNLGSSQNPWNFYPSAGADFEVGTSPGTAFLLRPDFTITPGSTLVTATIGFGIAIG